MPGDRRVHQPARAEPRRAPVVPRRARRPAAHRRRGAAGGACAGVSTVADFERRYRDDPDPWRFASSPYEQRRYDVTVACLPAAAVPAGLRTRHAAVGELTRRLAGALRPARRLGRRADGGGDGASGDWPRPPTWSCEAAAIPGDWPAGTFDLVVFSEIGYYFDARRAAPTSSTGRWRSLDPGGTLIAMHWLGHSADHVLHGDEVHAALGRGVRPRSRRRLPRRRASALDWWTRRDTGSLRRRRSGPRRGGDTSPSAWSRSCGRRTAAGLAHDRFELVVVADSCTDATAAIARRALGGRGVVVEARAGSAGRARAIGHRRRAAPVAVDPSHRVWTVHTDADSVVPEAVAAPSTTCRRGRLRRGGRCRRGGVVRRHSPATRRCTPPVVLGRRRRPPPRPRRQPRRARRRLSRRRRMVGDRHWRGPRAVERRPAGRVPDAVDPGASTSSRAAGAIGGRPRRFRDRPPALRAR